MNLRSSRLLAFAAATAFVIATGAYLMHAEWYGGDIEAGVYWPAQLSQAEQTHAAVTVTTPDGAPIAGASVELGYVPMPEVDYNRIPADRYWRSAGAAIASIEQAVFSDGDYRVLTRAETGPNGDVLLDIPAAQTFLEATEISDKPVFLVLRVRDGMDRWAGYARFARPSNVARLQLSTDRPLYQPGQKIRMRALLLDRATSKPLAAAGDTGGAAVEFRVHGPRKNLLFRERALVSPAGVASQSFDIAPDGQQGPYELTVVYHDSVVTETVEVRPYEKPRFEVALDVSSADKTVSGTVSADYFYGEPVAGADVDVALRPINADPSQTEPLARAQAKLDDEGRFAFDLAMPDDLGAAAFGGRLTLDATVTDPSGRTRRAQHRLAARAADYQVELLSANGALMRIGEPSEALVVVRGADGRPVENLDVSLSIPEDEQTQRFEVTTDDSGHARFEWTPGEPVADEEDNWHQRTVYATAKTKTPDGREVSHDVRVVLATPSAVVITPETATPRAGDTLAFELDFPAPPHRGRFHETAYVLALHEGSPVATTAVELSKDIASGSIGLDPTARGLIHLVAFARGPGAYGESHGWPYYRRGIPLGATTIWVRQSGDTAVDIDIASEQMRPGGEASIELSFPPGESATQGQPPVTFGAWAVDEALYTLAERADMPFSLLARQDAATLAAIAPALAPLVDGADNARIATARLSRDTAAIADQRIEQRLTDSLNYEFDARQKRPWLATWAVLAGLLVFVLLGFETRRVWRRFRHETFSRKLVSVFFGGLALLLVGWLILAQLSHGLAESIGLGVTGLLALAGLLGLFLCFVKSKELRFWQWAVSLIVATVPLALLFEFADGSAFNSQLDAIAVVVFCGAAVLVVVQALLWTSIMWSREHHAAALGPMTLVWLVPSFWFVYLFSMQAKEQMAASAPADHALESEVYFGEPDGPSVDSGESGDGELRVRDYFPDTMFWTPEVSSDAEGRARIDVDLPDSITTWRVHALAHTPDGRFGEGSAELEVRQPFFVELDLPAQLTAGDRVRLPVALVDGRRAPEGATTVEWSASAEGNLVTGTSRGAAEVQAGGRQVVWLDLEATGVGEGSLTIEARLQGDEGAAESFDGDAVRRSTTIVADGRRRSKTSSAVVGERWTATLDIPANAVTGTVAARVDLLPGPTAAALEGIESMLRQPHGCFEQTTSAAYPNVMILRRLEATEPDAWPGGAEAHARAQQRARDLVSEGYQRILTFQTESGGFALYPDREPNTLLTGYGLLQLAEIQETLGVDAGPAMRAAARWLADQERDEGGWAAQTPHGTQVSPLQSTALVVWAMSRLPSSMTDGFSSTIRSGTTWLEEAVSSEDARFSPGHLDLALAANALWAAGSRTAANGLLDQLAKATTTTEEMRYWEANSRSWMGSAGTYADVSTTALITRALMRADRHATLAHDGIDFLAQKRRPGGGWGTTEATVWALEAMESASTASDDPVNLAASVDGKRLGQARVIPDRGVPHTFRTELAPGSHTFMVEPEAETSVIAQASAEYSVPWTSPAARVDDEPFEVTIELESRRLRAGEPTRVEVTVVNRSGTSAESTIVRLPIPPGASVDPGVLETNAVDRVERTPTHLVVYLPHVEANARLTLPYTIVPRFGGRYTLPPVVAYPYYNPEPATERPGGTLTVRR